MEPLSVVSGKVVMDGLESLDGVKTLVPDDVNLCVVGFFELFCHFLLVERITPTCSEDREN